MKGTVKWFNEEKGFGSPGSSGSRDPSPAPPPAWR